jgi:hypothetical protein
MFLAQCKVSDYIKIQMDKQAMQSNGRANQMSPLPTNHASILLLFVEFFNILVIVARRREAIVDN